MALVGPDDAEAAGLEQADAARVPGKDLCGQLVQPALAGGLDQRAQQCAAGALPASLALDVDRRFADAVVVAAAVLVGAGFGETGDLAIALPDQVQRTVGDQVGDGVRRLGPGFEGR